MKIIGKLSLIATLLTGLSANAESTKSKKIVLNEDNSIYFGESFNFKSVANLQEQISIKDERLPAHKPLYIIIDSGGGGISAGLELISNVQSYKRRIHTITLFGASMAFQTVQGLGKRYITTNGTLMSHKARGGFYGEFGDGKSQLDSRYNFWLRKITTLDKHTVSRTNGKATLKSYRALYDEEYWCDGADCVNGGFADAVAAVTCDESLKGTTAKVSEFMWRGRNITLTVLRSKCPLVTGTLDVSVKVNGIKLEEFVRGSRWDSGSNSTSKRLETQDLWNHIQSITRKKTLPERVIYLEIPSESSSLVPSLK